MSFHVAMTAALLPDNKLKFQLGTPNHVWSAMERCWKICEPTSKSIVHQVVEYFDNNYYSTNS
jgi:hypothetical protein